MTIAKRYIPEEVEPRLQALWQRTEIYHFRHDHPGPVYSIDTPPPTVSGQLHLGHLYSYTHPDVIARFWRMRGYNVFYPMGYDDNGLPTERLVEKRLGMHAQQIGRQAFIEKCLQVSEAAEKEYESLWKRAGLSIDWRYSYRTIDSASRRACQRSFIELFNNGHAHHREAPAIWCPECQTSIAQAELEDRERPSEYLTLPFQLEDAGFLPIATTRPELLPACVAVFVHPQDERYRHLVGKQAIVPIFGQLIPILADASADPDKGTGAVMCCTFGDTADVSWWYTHNLNLIQSIDRRGCMTEVAGQFAGKGTALARQEITQYLADRELLLERVPTVQSIRVHERCDTPVEYVLLRQWFIRLLEFKAELIRLGEMVSWHPEHMQARYRSWVENLNWDWCISRQRYFGVPFPVWYCQECGEVLLAPIEQLPVDPIEQQPDKACRCGSQAFLPETDIFDTWATSSLTPQIIAQHPWTGRSNLAAPDLYERVFPFSLRPQAHEIIRTWAFYTIVKSNFHFGELPWKAVLISGWGIAGEGLGKISKSRGGGRLSPLKMIQRYSADAVRYWAASTSPGKDSLISEQKIQTGAKLINKLWNVARFSAGFFQGYSPPEEIPRTDLTIADRWVLSRCQSLVHRVTGLLESYEYATAKNEIELFFWQDFADNYLEMCKQRLYGEEQNLREAARFTLHHLLLTVIKLLAPYLPHVTEEIYLHLYSASGDSIHTSAWPSPVVALQDSQAESTGEMLVQVASAVRRYKSENKLSLGTELKRLQLALPADERARWEPLLKAAGADLMSITRARAIEITSQIQSGLLILESDASFQAAIELD